jgi:hypothetical protein
VKTVAKKFWNEFLPILGDFRNSTMLTMLAKLLTTVTGLWFILPAYYIVFSLSVFKKFYKNGARRELEDFFNFFNKKNKGVA